MGQHFANSDKTCAWVRQQSPRIILATSVTGVDSLCAWIQCLRYWEPEDIIPITQAYVPALDGRGSFQFLNDMQRQYERQFGRMIYSLPNSSWYGTLAYDTLQPPARYPAMTDLNNQRRLPILDHARYTRWIKKETGIPRNTWTALGIKQNDGPVRRNLIRGKGSAFPSTLNFYPIWDWTLERQYDELKKAGIRLSWEYSSIGYGRSICGMDNRFSSVLKQHDPQAWEVLSFWYPLVEADIFRIQQRPRLLEEQKRRIFDMAKRQQERGETEANMYQLQEDLADGVVGIRQTLSAADQQISTYEANTNLAFYLVPVFQTEEAMRAFLQRSGVGQLGDKYICGEDMARLLGYPVDDIPVPKQPTYRKHPIFEPLAPPVEDNGRA